MKILMTSSGGVIRGLNTPEYGLARELVRKGYDVTVASSASVMKKHDALVQEDIEGIKVRRFNPVLPSSLLYMLKNDFDLIHMHHLGYMAPISSYAALRRKIVKVPTVFTIHGLYHDPYLVEDTEDPFGGPIKTRIQGTFSIAPWRLADWLVHLPLQADRITALTQWEKKEVSKLGISGGKIDVIPNGIVLEKYAKRKSRPKDGKTLLFVGQPARRKGWQYFIEAMPRILKEIPDAKAVFIGYRKNDELEAMCRRHGIENSVRFLGFLPEDRKIQALQSSDVFVLPTLYEGFGQVFLEAMASGLPIVTTDVAGNKEIVEDRKNGILVKPKSSAEVADAAVNLLTNRNLRAKMKSNNLRKARNYDWKKVAKMFIKTYESVTG